VGQCGPTLPTTQQYLNAKNAEAAAKAAAYTAAVGQQGMAPGIGPVVSGGLPPEATAPCGTPPARSAPTNGMTSGLSGLGSINPFAVFPD
jgi:hypothetical protein